MPAPSPMPRPAPAPVPSGLRGLIGWLLRRRPDTGNRHPAPAGSDAFDDPDDADAAPRPIAVAGSQPDWLRVLSAQSLLQIVQAGKAITEIERLSGFSPAVFERDGLSALHRYAQFVQLLPASEAHHHAHAGGLLAHTVEMLLAALKGRNAAMLPEGATAEIIDAQRDEWTLVVFYAALLHDIGKPLTDLRIDWRAKNLDAVRWMPLAGSLPELAQGRAKAEYRVQFSARVERDYGAHSKTAVLLLQRIASREALSILARQPAAFDALNKYLSGQDRDSLLARIVHTADKASVQRALTSGSRARFGSARAVPLVDLLMQSLKAMMRDGTALPLNRSGAAGWVYDGSLWFVAKRVADATRAWIKKHDDEQSVPGETKNDRLFDTWQEYGCIVPNPHTGQAIWYVTVHGRGSPEAGRDAEDAPVRQGDKRDEEQGTDPGAYTHSLTMLRFKLDKLFEDPGQYPPPMLGSIEVHDKRKAADAAEASEAQAGEADSSGQDIEADPSGRGIEAGSSSPPKASRQDVEALPAAQPAPKDRKEGKPAAQAAPAIKAPTFNKPKPAPAPQPVGQQQARPDAAAVSRDAGALQPQAGAKDEPQAPSRKAVEIAQVSEDEADYLLDASDMASSSAMGREREQRLLARAAQQARKAENRKAEKAASGKLQQAPQPAAVTPVAIKPSPLVTAPPTTTPLITTPPVTAVPTATPPVAARPATVQPIVQQRSVTREPAPADPRRLLLQPVGGAHHTLLQGSPVPAQRTAANQAQDPSSTEEAGAFKPVLLEPKIPKLPGAREHKAQREAGASPVAMAFINWLQTALANRALKYNETGAEVHFVEHGMALVSPLIFKLYAATQVQTSEIAEHAMQVQREVVKAHWHVTGPGKTNILRYQVLGRSGAPVGKLAAIVLSEPWRFVQPVPPANPVLRLDGPGDSSPGGADDE